MRARRAIAPALLAVLVAGCGAEAAHQAGGNVVPAGMHRMADGTVMRDSDMGVRAKAEAYPAQPSSSAAMICTPQTHAALQHNLGLSAVPMSTDRWAGGVYTCTYHLSGGDLVVSVDDAADVAVGQRHFDAMRADIPDLHRIRGLQSFGLTGYADGRGTVLFLKEGKTLDVDATELPTSIGRYQQSPGDVAYGVAAAVLACWSEH